ncbi:MAG: hypothetical protein ACOX05_01890 [Bacillota bacterium]|jgi:hypothetical protein
MKNFKKEVLVIILTFAVLSMSFLAGCRADPAVMGQLIDSWQLQQEQKERRVSEQLVNDQIELVYLQQEYPQLLRDYYTGGVSLRQLLRASERISVLKDQIMVKRERLNSAP